MASPTPLVTIGWPIDQPLPDLPDAHRLLRVTGQHRNAFDVHDGHDAVRAQAPRGLVPDADGQPTRPAVGDWVLASGSATPATLVALLSRRNLLKRGAAGERYGEQILACNLDLAVVVMGLDGDYNPRRLQRYLTLIAGTGIEVIVVLSKADRCADVEARLAEIQALAGEAAVLAINGKDERSVAPISARLGPGRTGVLLGSSGAGKSTLSNTLMGSAQQKTGSVRAHDSRGRHTTTVRSLLKLPGGGCLIDSPGMRELKLTGEETVEDDGFAAELERLAEQCRFRDCRHDSEPGCALRAALDSGALDAGRLAHHRKLEAERDLAAAQRAALQRRIEEKTLSRALGQRLIDKYGKR